MSCIAPPGVCKTCGGAELRTVSETVTEVLAYVPGALRGDRHVRPACSCRKCETMMQAPMPDLPIPRGMVDASFLAHIVVANFATTFRFIGRPKFTRDRGSTSIAASSPSGSGMSRGCCVLWSS